MPSTWFPALPKRISPAFVTSRVGTCTPPVLAAAEGKPLPLGREYLSKGERSQKPLSEGCPVERQWLALSLPQMTQPISSPSPMIIIALSCTFVPGEEEIGAPGGRQASAPTWPPSPPATAGLLGGLPAAPAPG